MKKILSFLLILLIAFGVYVLYTQYFSKQIPKLEVEDDVIILDELFVYGTYLNFQGSIIDDENLDLVLYNGDFISYNININSSYFNLSDKINEGINLEKIPIGKYYVFIRSTTKDENDNDLFKYYCINNNTEYKETFYHSLSNKNNLVSITTDDEYKTLIINVSKDKETNVYDLVIDPGHGGKDSGASKNGKNEADYTMKIANLLKKKLTDNGVKVKLTREEGQLSKNEKLADYGPHGRAVINHEVNAKYVFSIHLNSNPANYVHGVEIYTAANINYDFANNLAKSIVDKTDSNYSTSKTNKINNGVYTRTFSTADIENSLKEYADINLNAYNITTKSNYYFMIRETGGIMTGAYVDDRNAPDKPGNPYYNSNVGSEAYLFELAYLSNTNDLNNLDKNIEKYCDAIVDEFMKKYNS